MSYKPHPISQLNDEQMALLIRTLKNKKQELLSHNNKLKEVMTKKHDCAIADFADSAKIKEESILALTFHQENIKLLELIDMALNRAKAGIYGVSLKTGEAIPFDRLKLVPWATACVKE